VTFDQWLGELERRHLTTLTASEVGRSLRALSSCYVERREKLVEGAALDGAGKRAAFALFYGVQHFLVAREIARALPVARADRIVDLGCGTGTAGAGLALEIGAARIEGFDISRWAVAEANWTYRALQLHGRAALGNIRRARLPEGGLVLAAYAVNELTDDIRHELRQRMLEAHRRGTSILIIEPIARRANRWWGEWTTAFAARGGRESDWRFSVALPERQRALARAAGLDARELTARTLYLFCS